MFWVFFSIGRALNLRGESIPGELLVLWCGRGVEGVGRVRRHRRRRTLSMLVGVQVLLVVPEPKEAGRTLTNVI